MASSLGVSRLTVCGRALRQDPAAQQCVAGPASLPGLSQRRSTPAQIGVFRRGSHAACGRSARMRSPFSVRAASVPAAPEQNADHLLETAKKAAAAGAAVVAAALDKPRNITFKGATDLVTETDKASEEAVLKVIMAAFPDHAILGEEGGVFGNTSSEYLWCVDPLDGTTNFAHQYLSFAVSVAVCRRGLPVASCVVEFTGGRYAWAQREYTASLGGGARCNGHPLRVSDTSDIRRSLLVTGFGYDHGLDWEANLELFRHFTDVTQGVRRLGSASVDLCHVALGMLDGYWEYQLKPWDMAAGALVLTEAGGKVTKGDGSPFNVFAKSIIASNTHLHEQMLAQIGPKTKGLVPKGFDLKDWFVPEGYEFDHRG